MRITFKIKDGVVVLTHIEFDNDNEMTGLEGKKIVYEHLKEQFENGKV